MCSADSFTSEAARLSASCSCVFAPMMTLVTKGRGELPGERDARHGDVGLFRNRPQRSQHASASARGPRGEIERRAPRPFRTRLVGVELAGQQPPSERAPRQDREPRTAAQRDDLPLDVAPRDRVVDLPALEPGEAVGVGVGDRFHREPRWEVREADVADLPGAHDVVERAHGLLDGGVLVDAVDPVEVDEIELRRRRLPSI